MQVNLNSPLPSRGLLMVESKLGWMVSDSTPVLLLEDMKLAQEVERILRFSTSGRARGAMRAPLHTPSSQSIVGQTAVGHSREIRAGESYLRPGHRFRFDRQY